MGVGRVWGSGMGVGVGVGWRWEAGVIRVSDPYPHFIPNMPNGINVWTLSWSIHDLVRYPCAIKAVVSCAVWGVALSWTCTKFPRLLFIGWMHAYVSLYPCLQCTRALPSLWNSVKRDSSVRTHCLKCLRWHFLCVLPHARQSRLWSKINLGHPSGRLDI